VPSRRPRNYGPARRRCHPHEARVAPARECGSLCRASSRRWASVPRRRGTAVMASIGFQGGRAAMELGLLEVDDAGRAVTSATACSYLAALADSTRTKVPLTWERSPASRWSLAAGVTHRACCCRLPTPRDGAGRRRPPHPSSQAAGSSGTPGWVCAPGIPPGPPLLQCRGLWPTRGSPRPSVGPSSAGAAGWRVGPSTTAGHLPDQGL
jgi:hypothetical protein